MPYLKYIILLAFSLTNCTIMVGQNAEIGLMTKSLKTYPFSDPNRQPILTTNPKIYPYFKYEGYSHEGTAQDWKVVTLENELVRVFVLPEAGGKVWGAIEKSTGEEFIYRNEVMKFRNISMRGPWTSGGIEFNFGIIGHHPSTATPVDYIVQRHSDGSVSCTVGNIDLPSRTQWRVKITLPKDKAYFETKSLWYNPTPNSQSYYNWMTAAAPAQPDFEFYTPGDQFLKHSGQALPWSINDSGRDLALYKDNNFGPSKSYHVVGEYNDFFGGYYHQSKYGFGHWAEYEEMPGQKLWLWALSRSGGIWEDLLTDTDGQYIEFQAGRLFVQYSPGAHVNPITQANFEPHASDSWKEIWFPIKDIGGITDASEMAVMNIHETNDTLIIGVNPFQNCTATLKVSAGDSILHHEILDLTAMENFKTIVGLSDQPDYKIEIEELDLLYNSTPNENLIERPFDSGAWPEVQSAEKIYQAALESIKSRLYADGLIKLKETLGLDPYHSGAMIKIADIYYRRGHYEKGLQYANKALRLNTYDPAANYIAGILYRGTGDFINAKESLGWAARSLTYRSAAYAQIAELWLAENALMKGEKYANKSLDFNRYNINALMVKTISARLSGRPLEAQSISQKIIDIDPLNHFAYFEKYLSTNADKERAQFINRHQSELPIQTYLELAISYANMGRTDEALQVLAFSPQDPVVGLWSAYLSDNTDASAIEDITSQSPSLVFPFRRETIEVLQWANSQSDHWKLKYYLALNLWGKDRIEEAVGLLKDCKEQPDYDVFYSSRAYLLNKLEDIDELKDLSKAHSLNPGDHRNLRALTTYHSKKKNYRKALANAKQAYNLFPNNDAVSLDYVRILLDVKEYQSAINILAQIHILPFEGASEGRQLYEQAFYGRALQFIKEKDYNLAIGLLETSKKWPERLGVGKPYNPDERIADYLIGYVEQHKGNHQRANEYFQLVADASMRSVDRKSLKHLLALKSMEYLGDKNTESIFINHLMESPHATTVETKWLLAKYRKEELSSNSLELVDRNDTILLDISNLMD